MKKQLTLTIAIVMGLLCMMSSAHAQCTKQLTYYGYGSVPSGYATFGQIVAPAGDVDNDGHPDILVAGTEDYFAIDATVTAFSGITGDSIRVFYRSYNTVRSACSFGDYNNDDYDDILVNGIVYSGLTGDTLRDFTAHSIYSISAGDANGDNIHDLIVPNAGYSTNLGRVDLISGLTGDTLQSWIGSETGSRFGSSFASAGDVNNDGHEDVLVGQASSDYGGTDRGRIYVYSGIDGSELFNRIGENAYELFGAYLSGAGDLNDDNHDDILVAGQSENSTTAPLKVWVLSGSTGDTLYTIPFPDTSFTLTQSIFAKFGYSMDGVGDISNDGYGDFIISAYRYADNRGNAYLFSGKDGSLLYEVFNIYERDRDLLGSSVAGVGDTDGDGSPDIAIGAMWAEGLEDPTNDANLRGAVYLFTCLFPSYECQIYDDFDLDLWSNVCDNCKWFQNVFQEDSDLDGIGDLCEQTLTLLAGSNRYIIFPEINWNWTGQDPHLTFDTVLFEGSAHFELTPLNESVTGFREIPWQGPMKYTFSTEAIYEGPINIKLPYLDTNFTDVQEEELQLFQKVGTVWRNITTSPPNTYNNTIEGVTYTLGDFAIGTCLISPDDDVDGVGDLCDNCPSVYNPLQEDADINGIGDACESSLTLPAGSDATANLTTATDSVSINFSTVSQEGVITLSVITNGPASEENFTLYPADPPRYYEITTDALYSGDVTLTMSYDDSNLSLDEENLISLWHFENNTWVDITNERNTVNNYVTGISSSLSPFVVGILSSPTDIDDFTPEELPDHFSLRQNYPNPFNPQTVVEYSLSSRSKVVIEIFNITGQKIRTLVNDEKAAGIHQVVWNGDDSNGEKVSSGIYLYRFNANNYIETKKMILIK